MVHNKAKSIAEKWVRYLTPACERIEIAGSIRRGRMEVGDIDLVCKPLMMTEPDLFGQPTEINFLEETVQKLIADENVALLMNGPKHKKLALPEGIKLELWIVLPPAQWGPIMMIRTGPADFSHWMVTAKRMGGALPSYLRQKDGAVWHGAKMIEIPEEEDYFKLCNMKYVEPQYRQAQWEMVRRDRVTEW